MNSRATDAHDSPDPEDTHDEQQIVDEQDLRVDGDGFEADLREAAHSDLLEDDDEAGR